MYSVKEMEKSLKYEKFQTSQKKRPTAPIVPITNIQQLPVFCHILQFLKKKKTALLRYSTTTQFIHLKL